VHPQYLVAGFVDWLGNCTAERSFTDLDPSKRWNYPDLWHTVNVAVPPDWGTMQIILLDTVTLSGEMNDNNGAHNIPLGLGSPPGFESFTPAPTAAPIPVTLAAAPIPAVTTPIAPVPAISRAATPTAVRAASPNATVAHTRTPAAVSVKKPAAAGPKAAPKPKTVVSASGTATEAGSRRRLRDFNRNYNPPISTLQWQWLEAYLNASTAQWLVVVGNDPIWSAGEHGPTWSLVDKLLPILDAAGVSLYISGRDPLAQHFVPTAEYPSVDFVGIGTGAGANASQAETLPSGSLNPSGTLQWSYGASGAFLTVSMGVDSRDAKSTLMTVTFYGEGGEILHSFTKPNPRTKGSADPPTGRLSGSGGSVAATAIGEGALVLVMLFVIICGGVGYFWHLSNAPPEKEKVKRVAAPPPAAAQPRAGETLIKRVQQAVGAAASGSPRAPSRAGQALARSASGRETPSERTPLVRGISKGSKSSLPENL